jgi:tRNA G10  N-methylase Trm11
MKEAIKSAKPKMRWRRWLMSTEELAVIHAEGEKAWELHKKFEEITIGKLDVLVRAARFSS